MQNQRNQTIYILEYEILDFYPYFVFVCLEDFGGWRRTELAQAKTNVCVTRGGNLQGYAAAAAYLYDCMCSCVREANSAEKCD